MRDDAREAGGTAAESRLGLKRPKVRAAIQRLLSACGKTHTCTHVWGTPTQDGRDWQAITWATRLVCFFAGSLVTTPVVYLWTHSPLAIAIAAGLNGAFTLGQFAWMAIYPPELFPTAVRATAVSLIFNTMRFISFLGPLVAGILITRLGGYGSTAMLFSLAYLLALCAVPFLPETKGKPLPE